MNEVYWIWLNALKGVSLESKKRLLLTLKDVKSIYEVSWLDLPEGVMVKSEFDNLQANKCLKYAEKTHTLNLNASVQQLTISKARSLGLSTELRDWPILVYYKGSLVAEKSVAVVGTRSNTIHGYHYAKEICKRYTSNGFFINTGLADGIESIALDYTLNNSGKVMLFVPHGPEICYPKRKWRLLEHVLEKGAVISPFTAGVPVYRHNFLQRNALMAMWSSEVVLVEAPRESGSLSIACHGLKYDKPVYTVSSVHGSAKCAGNMNLIRDYGAQVLDLKLPNSIEALLCGPLVKVLQTQACSFDDLKALLPMDSSLMTQTLLMLEHHRIIEFKPNGKWHYNGW